MSLFLHVKTFGKIQYNINWSQIDPLLWMGAVRMRVQTTDTNVTVIHTTPVLKEHSTILEIGSSSYSPRVKQLSFNIFESIQPFYVSYGSTFSVALHRWLYLIRPLAYRSKMMKVFQYMSSLSHQLMQSGRVSGWNYVHGWANVLKIY